MAKTGWLSGLARTVGGAKRTQPARRRLILERLEERLALSAVVVTGNAGGVNDLVVNATGPDIGSYSLNGGAPVNFSNATSFTFNAESLLQSNTMTVNNPTGGLFAPSGGVFFNGANPATNSLTVQGGAAVTETFSYGPNSASGAHNGTFSLSNGSATAAYSYTNLQPILVNAGTPQDATFNLPTEDAGLYHLNQIQPSGAPGQWEILSQDFDFETTTFAVPSHSLTVNLAGAAGQSITLSPSTTGAAPFITLNGGAGPDTFNLQATAASTVTVNGGASGFSRLTVDAQEQPIGAVPGALTIDGHPAVIYTGIAALNLNNFASVNALAIPDTVDRRTSAITAASPDLSPQEAFVDQLYLNALGRLGAKSELDGWAALFSTPGFSQSQAQAAIATDIEHSAEARGHLVQSWYVIFLGRSAVGGEEQGWVNLLLAGQTEEQMLSGILSSAEFYNRAQTLGLAGTADQQYVEALYLLVLNRTGASSEVAGWINALPSLGRQGMALAFLHSTESRAAQFEGYYNVLLNRPDDQPGLNSWVFSNLDMTSVRVGFEAGPEFFTAAQALIIFSQGNIA
jgi:Domain of unknown function (DUF4214)